MRLGRRELSGGLAGPDAQAMVDGPVESRGIAEGVGVLPFEVSHFFNDINALRGVQDLVENSRPFEPQIHQCKVDIVVAAAPRLERIARDLLYLYTRAHLRQFLARTAALP